jgi:ABC-type transporter Mla subunit MlaD
MAVGTLLTTVLQNVPWSDVVANAPRIADGARKLWHKVGRGKQASEADAAVPRSEAALGDLPAVQAQVRALEADVARLTEEMAASSSLLKALAEQNAVLIERIEQNRRRTTVIAWVAAVALCAAVASWTFAWPH